MTAIEILSLLLNSGFAALLFKEWLSRKKNSAEQVRSVEFVYKELYTDLKKQVVDLQRELTSVKSKLRIHDEIAQKAKLCGYYNNDCPLRLLPTIDKVSDFD